MSDPVTNVQIEDVLSSIRRLVSEEIGQQEPLKPRKLQQPSEDEQKLVLSPAQKIRKEAAEQGSDLWEATEEMAPQEAAPVWWHRDASETRTTNENAATDEPIALGDPVTDDAAEIAAAEQDDILTEVEASAEPDVSEEEQIASALSGFETTIDIEDDDFEPPEGEADIDTGVEIAAMPWQGDEEIEVYQAMSEPAVEEEVADAPDDAPFQFRPGERLFERLSSKKMTASHLPEVETVESASVEEDIARPTPEPEPVQAATPQSESYFEDDADLSNIFDEDMLRDLVKDIIRQELQGVLGERITRNVRKLVRREIQRAMTDLKQDLDI